MERDQTDRVCCFHERAAKVHLRVLPPSLLWSLLMLPPLVLLLLPQVLLLQVLLMLPLSPFECSLGWGDCCCSWMSSPPLLLKRSSFLLVADALFHHLLRSFSVGMG